MANIWKILQTDKSYDQKFNWYIVIMPNCVWSGYIRVVRSTRTNTSWKKGVFGHLALMFEKVLLPIDLSTWLILTALVSKYQIYDADCLGISSNKSLLRSLSSLLTRPTTAEMMVDRAILARQATSAMATLAAANPPSSQWQPPSASIITVFFQPNRKYLR